MIQPDRAATTLLYDADCGFCTVSAQWLRRRRLGVAISPLQRADLTALGVDGERARREIPFVERGTSGVRVSYGHVAVGSALATGGPGWWLVGWLLLHPPVSWLARAGYALVARNRHRLPGSTSACRIDGGEEKTLTFVGRACRDLGRPGAGKGFRKAQSPLGSAGQARRRLRESAVRRSHPVSRR